MFQEAQPSQLSLFHLPPTQTAVEKNYFQEYRPISQLSNNYPIEFNIASQNGMEYIDMRRSQMYVKCRLHKSEISSSDNVGPINLPLQALFSQVDVGVQNKQISSTAGHYPFKAYIQCLLRYNKEAKKSQLTSQLWIRDTAGSYDDADVQTGANIGLYERAKYFSKGRRVDLQGPIYHDLFGLDRYIINQVKMMAIPRGQVNFTWDNCINGVRPLRCVLGFVNSLAVSGAYNLCPWHFQHYDLSQITLSLDGLPVGGNPLRLNFDDVNGITTVPALVNLMETTGKWMSDSGNGIDRDDISTGTALYAFDIEPQFHTDHYLSLLKYGNLRIDCQFHKPLPEAVTCVLYVETPGYFEINKARDVVLQG
ncbi:hypothetical protein FSP39_003053 [Pinctada imbricata]|uniref:Capsid protein n=1 Tax=Pinctada imbricata TaxID=66713 RepID=A0AA89C5E8_PINIB|nr:hypothetical protein FSP39_003053 [Pinctada imbricata]